MNVWKLFEFLQRREIFMAVTQEKLLKIKSGHMIPGWTLPRVVKASQESMATRGQLLLKMDTSEGLDSYQARFFFSILNFQEDDHYF